MIEVREFATWGEHEALRIRKWVPFEDYAQEIAALRDRLTACQLERSEAYDLRDAAEGRYCTALMETERLKAHMRNVAGWLNNRCDPIHAAGELLLVAGLPPPQTCTPK